jgi:hypothetical protein
MFSTRWLEGHTDKTIRGLELNVFAWQGSRPTKGSRPKLRAVLRRVESPAANEGGASGTLSVWEGVPIRDPHRRDDRDWSRDLSGALSPTQEKRLASITELLTVGELLRASTGCKGVFVTGCAWRLAPLVFVRPSQLRHAMEGVRFRQSGMADSGDPQQGSHAAHGPAVYPCRAILRELQPITGRLPFAFPSVRVLPCHERECDHRRASSSGSWRSANATPSCGHNYAEYLPASGVP